MSWARNSVGERGDNIGLPDVTTADNGKIMEVESGEWKLKEGSGGGGLPEITEADEGKFLGVVSGEAAWATAGGGGGSGLIIPEVTPTGETTFSCDMTFAQIMAAVNQNTCISAKFVGSIFYLDTFEEDFSINFTRVTFSDEIVVQNIAISSEDVVTYWEDS